MLDMPNWKDVKFALFGHGYHICRFSKLLIAQGFQKPVIITHPRAEHERDIRLLGKESTYQNIFDVADKLELELLEAKSVNTKEVSDYLIKHHCNAGFSFSCRSIIKSEIISILSGKIFNIHPSMLPKERGGGTFSWRIMRGINEAAGTLHVLTEGIDEGPIIYQKRKNMVNKRPIPADMLYETFQLFDELLDTFVDDLKKNAGLNITPQNEEAGTYLPRLHTETNGAIDWTWSGDEIDRFIRAFSRPYPGAFTYVGSNIIHIIEATYEKSDSMHPYMSGRIVNASINGDITVYVRDGILNIHKIRIDDDEVKPAQYISLLNVLHTPPDIIAKSRSVVVKVSQMK
ncbi:MAG: formyltransferase family protein [Gammaproteobacteria bacterium]|nr:formyltransferase family protein [Gammaproteobacteria bacterium]